MRKLVLVALLIALLSSCSRRTRSSQFAPEKPKQEQRHRGSDDQGGARRLPHGARVRREEDTTDHRRGGPGTENVRHCTCTTLTPSGPRWHDVTG